ncbi:major facilitator superfamily domain-containing protein [Lipomyces starkeyi]
MADQELSTILSSPSHLEPGLSITTVNSDRPKSEFDEAGIPFTVSPSRFDFSDIRDLEQIQSQISIQRETAGDLNKLESSNSSFPLPAFGGGKDYPPIPPDRENYVVEFDGAGDPMHPQNWRASRKIRILIIMSFNTFCSAWGSAIYSTATEVISAKFHVSAVVVTLGLSLYVLGFAFGPLLWAPTSELYGRMSPLVFSTVAFAIFQMGAARAEDFQTLMLCRFFSGFAAACPLAVVPGVFTDIFGNSTRGLAVACYGTAVFLGPLLGPVVGGFIVESYLGWRWTEYLSSIMSFFSFALMVLFTEETYAPAILTKKAADLRRRTGNWGIQSRQEQVELNLHELLEKNFARPLVMLVREPILMLVTIYVSFIYGILYLLLDAIPIIFIEGYGMAPQIGELPYLGVAIGLCIGGGIIMLFQPYTLRKIAANGGNPVPEERLIPTMMGSVLFPIGLFWLGWTGNYPHAIPWIVPTLAGSFVGGGIILIFLSSVTYIVESYLVFAASAMAANTIVRSAFAAGFPLFARAMFHNLGNGWASTLLGCIGVVLIPVPFVFYVYGKKIRGASRYAPQWKQLPNVISQLNVLPYKAD